MLRVTFFEIQMRSLGVLLACTCPRVCRDYDADKSEWVWAREAPASQKAPGGGDAVKKLKKKVRDAAGPFSTVLEWFYTLDAVDLGTYSCLRSHTPESSLDTTRVLKCGASLCTT